MKGGEEMENINATRILLSIIARNGSDQREVAEKLELSHSSINKKINGRIVWNVSDIKAICEMFDISDEELRILVCGKWGK